MNNNITKTREIKAEDTNKYLLQIKDKNITIEPGIKEEKREGQKYIVFTGTLTYTPKKCDCCQCENKNNTIVKNGFNELTKVKLLKISGLPAILELKKQRFKCKNCKKKFVARTSFVNKYCHISKNVKLSIKRDLTDILSFKQIAKMNGTSVNTVVRVLETCKEQVEIKNYTTLPEYLCFDEIKSTKDSKYGMSFVFSNALTHDFIDIVDGRTEGMLKKYFSRFTKKARKKVKVVCIDIYTPYMNVIKNCFPKADIVIDRFHIVQNINRELNKTRVQLMNQYKNKKGKEGIIYTILKNNWKLLLEDEDNVTHEKFFYNKSFKKLVTRRDILDYMLEIDTMLKESYELVQDVRYALKNKNILELERLIDEKPDNISEGVAKAMNTMKKHKEYMLNSAKYPFSNGPLEGFNNKIKVLKRVSFGYGSFYNFRLRILVVSRLFVSEYKDNIKNKANKKKTKQPKAA